MNPLGRLQWKKLFERKLPPLSTDKIQEDSGNDVFTLLKNLKTSIEEIKNLSKQQQNYFNNVTEELYRRLKYLSDWKRDHE